MNIMTSPRRIAEDMGALSELANFTSDGLRALSHEHRLMILSLLAEQERSVGELEQLLKLPQPAVSQQLARLRLDDLVISRRDGRMIFYSLDSKRLESIYRSLGSLLGIGMQATVVLDNPVEFEAPQASVA